MINAFEDKPGFIYFSCQQIWNRRISLNKEGVLSIPKTEFPYYLDVKSFFSGDSIKKNFGSLASTYAWGRHFYWNGVLEADFFSSSRLVHGVRDFFDNRLKRCVIYRVITAWNMRPQKVTWLGRKADLVRLFRYFLRNRLFSNM